MGMDPFTLFSLMFHKCIQSIWTSIDEKLAKQSTMNKDYWIERWIIIHKSEYYYVELQYAMYSTSLTIVSYLTILTTLTVKTIG